MSAGFTFPPISNHSRNNFLNLGAYNTSAVTVRFYATDAGNTINPGDSGFSWLWFDGPGGSWEFTSNSATSTLLSILQGTVTFPSEMFYIQ